MLLYLDWSLIVKLEKLNNFTEIDIFLAMGMLLPTVDTIIAIKQYNSVLILGFPWFSTNG
jgi:hypothetical protein